MKLSYETSVIYFQPLHWFSSVTDVFRQLLATSFTLDLTLFFFFFKFYFEGHRKKNRTENPDLIGTVSLYREGGAWFVLNTRQSCVLRW